MLFLMAILSWVDKKMDRGFSGQAGCLSLAPPVLAIDPAEYPPE
jgi:hypothetical protein